MISESYRAQVDLLLQVLPQGKRKNDRKNHFKII